MDRQESDPHVKEAIKDAVREIASPTLPSIGWEAICGVICLLLYLFTLPAVVGNRLPYLLDASVPRFILNFVLFAFSAGLSFSAVRQNRGRVIGIMTCGSAVLLLCAWLFFLVF